MDAVREYLIRIICAAVVCAVVTHLTQNNKTQGAIVKIMTGVFMVLTVIAPLKQIDFRDLTAWDFPGNQEAAQAIAMGKEQSETELRRSIKEQLEAYILQEASRYDARLSVEVTLGEGEYPGPQSVYITGSISPYAKRQLTAIMENQLGIPKEAQQWNERG